MKTYTTINGKSVRFAKNVITEMNRDISNHIVCLSLLAKYNDDENSYYITIANNLKSEFDKEPDFILGDYFDYKVNKELILELLNFRIEYTYYPHEYYLRQELEREEVSTKIINKIDMMRKYDRKIKL
jgi:hypothetical protein